MKKIIFSVSVVLLTTGAIVFAGNHNPAFKNTKCTTCDTCKCADCGKTCKGKTCMKGANTCNTKCAPKACHMPTIANSCGTKCGK